MWKFSTLREARLHPIPQMDDVYAESADQLVAQYGREHIDGLLRLFEGRDRSRLVDAIETWRASRPSATLAPEARGLIWDRLVRAAASPPADPADIVRITREDRAAREGRVLRSFSASTRPLDPADMQPSKGSNMTKRSRIADTSTISITTEEGKNPKREGTPSHERFALYKDGMTVKQAKEAGVRAADISYDSEKGFISLTEAEETAAE